MTSKKWTVLIADDSMVIVNLIKAILDESNSFEVVAIAHDGVQAVELAETHKPDLITMDICMPFKDGFQATKEIMEKKPTPIVIISSNTDKTELKVTFNALASGALGVLAKPSLSKQEGFGHFKKMLLTVCEKSARVALQAPQNIEPEEELIAPVKTETKKINYRQLKPKLLAIGSSTGGPDATAKILSSLDDRLFFPVVIVQHMTEGFLDGYVAWLNSQVNLPVSKAQHCETLLSGQIYVAPESYHMTVKSVKGQCISYLLDEPPVKHFKPSIDVFLKSVAKVFDRECIAGILTGMGSDGAEGLLEVYKKDNYTFAQSESSCIVYGMPQAAKKLGAVSEMLDLNEVSDMLSTIIGS